MINTVKNLLISSLASLWLAACSQGHSAAKYLNHSGSSIRERIPSPTGYQWVEEARGSFGEFLQYLPLEPHGAQILDFRGNPIGNQSEHVAVLQYDVGRKDLQQCADAVIRIRAEYLYATDQHDKIAFQFTNGDTFRWNDYKKGYRPVVTPDHRVSFEQRGSYDDSYVSFKKYLEIIFIYAGTISLFRDTKKVESQKAIQAGDVLITPGSPGHAAIIVGRAEGANGKKVFLLAQGYTPAQSIHIITNPFSSSINPWYELNPSNASTPTARYTFVNTEIRSFR